MIDITDHHFKYLFLNIKFHLNNYFSFHNLHYNINFAVHLLCLKIIFQVNS
jgi:hypothetical protein